VTPRRVVAAAGDFLRRGGVRGDVWDRLPRGSAVALLLGCSALYGAVMAGYNGMGGDRDWMILYGALKVPMLFVVTMLLAVPCFYVLNLLSGAGDHFPRVWRGLVDFQITVSLQLLALVPVTLFINLTDGDYRVAQAASSLLFGGAAWNARRGLAAQYVPLIAENPVHRRLRGAWFALYTFIGIQMGWDLRPFVGSPDMPVQFFRADIGNAYVEIPRVLAEAVHAIVL
jgi:hypothetical protein